VPVVFAGRCVSGSCAIFHLLWSESFIRRHHRVWMACCEFGSYARPPESQPPTLAAARS